TDYPGANRLILRTYFQKILAASTNPAFEVSEAFLYNFGQLESVQSYMTSRKEISKVSGNVPFTWFDFEALFPDVSFTQPSLPLMMTPLMPSEDHRALYREMLANYFAADPNRCIGVLYDVNYTPSGIMQWFDLWRTSGNLWFVSKLEFQCIMWFRM